jgi:hypothetical protein
MRTRGRYPRRRRRWLASAASADMRSLTEPATG